MESFLNPIKIKTQNIKVLVTGATGYIGGRLIPRLLANNIKVRVLVRDKDKIKNKSWINNVEIFEGDLTKLETLKDLCDGIEQAFYLIHSMTSSEEYIELDRLAVKNFVKNQLPWSSGNAKPARPSDTTHFSTPRAFTSSSVPAFAEPTRAAAAIPATA